jgi:hypothetical protein
MKRSLALLATAAAVACSSNNNTPVDAGGDSGTFVEPPVNVSGTVMVHPTLQAWHTANGIPVPSIAGTNFEAQEPLLEIECPPSPNADLGDDDNLPASGDFSLTGVKTEYVVLGIIAVVQDTRSVYPGLLPDGGIPDAGSSPDAGLEVVPSGFAQFPRSLTTICQGKSLCQGGQSLLQMQALTGITAYAFTYDFLVYLDGVMNLSGANELLTQGFIFGRVLDSSGAPVSGFTVVDTTNQVMSSQIFYLNDTLTAVKPSTDPTTGAKGVFIIPNAGASANPPSFVVYQSGSRVMTYPSHLGGSKSGSVFQLDLAPSQ